MGPEKLDRLDREELVELILRQRRELAARESEVAAQREELARRDARVRELEEEVARLRRPAKTPENSSVRPSQGQKADRTVWRHGSKRGPKRGHLGTSRPRQTPDVVLHCRPATGRGRGAALEARDQRVAGRTQATDLPPVRPVVVEAAAYRTACTVCGAWTAGAYPAGLEPHRTFGPQLEAVLGYLREAHHLSYERLETVCRICSGCGLASGRSSTRWSGWPSGRGRHTPRSGPGCGRVR